MCNANDVYIPVLVGDENGQLVVRQFRHEPARMDHVHVQEEVDDEGCDVITWLILVAGFLLVIATTMMPCSCALVEGIEREGNALLRGATNLLHTDKVSISTDNTADTRLHSSEMTPVFTTKITHEFEEDSRESSEDPSEDFHVYSGLPKEDEFHVYSGLPKDEKEEDSLNLPLTEGDADDDEFNEEGEKESDVARRSIERHMKSRTRRSPSKEDSSSQHIFISKWLDHFFVSMSKSNDEPAPELLESEPTSEAERESEGSSSHVIPESQYDIARATESSSSGVETEEDSPKSYSISYDEVVVAAISDDDENVIVEPAIRRRTLVQAEK